MIKIAIRTNRLKEIYFLKKERTFTNLEVLGITSKEKIIQALFPFTIRNSITNNISNQRICLSSSMCVCDLSLD